MAHHYMQKKLIDLGKENDIIVSSCGTSAMDGERSTTNSITVMKKYDVDLDLHKATNIFNIDITSLLIGAIILILIPIVFYNHDNSYNIEDAFFLLSKLKEKVFTLKEYIYGSNIDNIDIDDPWGYSIKIYDECAKDIVECVDKLIEKI